MLPPEVEEDRLNSIVVAENHFQAVPGNLVIVPLIFGMGWVKLVGKFVTPVGE